MSAIGYYRLGYSFLTPRFSTFLKTPTSKLLDGHHGHKVELLTHTHCKTVQELQLKVLASVEVSLDDVKHKKQMTRWDYWFAIIVVLVAVCYCFWKSLGWRQILFHFQTSISIIRVSSLIANYGVYKCFSWVFLILITLQKAILLY